MLTLIEQSLRVLAFIEAQVQKVQAAIDKAQYVLHLAYLDRLEFQADKAESKVLDAEDALIEQIADRELLVAEFKASLYEKEARLQREISRASNNSFGADAILAAKVEAFNAKAAAKGWSV